MSAQQKSKKAAAASGLAVIVLALLQVFGIPVAQETAQSIGIITTRLPEVIEALD